MKINTQIKKLDHYDVHERSNYEKIGALVLTAVTLLGIAAESQHIANKVMKTDVIANPSIVTTHPPEPPEKSELVRMPIKFDEGLRAPATVGA